MNGPMHSTPTILRSIAACVTLLLTPTSAVHTEEPRVFTTECGETPVPPAVFEALCLATCGDGAGRVACRHSESRGSFYDERATGIETLDVRVIGMIEVEDLALQLEGHTGWTVEIDPALKQRWIPEGRWRTRWAELPNLMIRLVDLGKLQIIPDGDAGLLSFRPATLTTDEWAAEIETLTSEAKGGDARAAYYLGTLYFEGREIPQSDTEAIKWWRQAAKRGNTDAQTALGGMYYKGRGVRRNYVKAADWYRRASARGDDRAESYLCSLIFERKVTPWVEEEFNCVSRAARRGVAEAQYRLGRMFAEGDFIYKDYTQAYLWLSLAAQQRFEDADTWCEIIRSRMTPEQRAEAEELIREWSSIRPRRFPETADGE